MLAPAAIQPGTLDAIQRIKLITISYENYVDNIKLQYIA